jgi:hypothetical protein
MKNHRLLFSRHFQDTFLCGKHPGVEPRLRKTYVAAKLSDHAGRQTRARRNVPKEARAKVFGPFGFGARALNVRRTATRGTHSTQNPKLKTQNL